MIHHAPLLLLLAACSRPFPLDPGADAPAAPEAAEAGATWIGTVRSRIAAESRAILWQEGTFRAALAPVGLSARFDELGVEIADDEGPVLAVRTAAWGRESLLRPFLGTDPRLGACTAEVDALGACIQRLEVSES